MCLFFLSLPSSCCVFSTLKFMFCVVPHTATLCEERDIKTKSKTCYYLHFSESFLFFTKWTQQLLYILNSKIHVLYTAVRPFLSEFCYKRARPKAIFSLLQYYCIYFFLGQIRRCGCFFSPKVHVFSASFPLKRNKTKKTNNIKKNVEFIFSGVCTAGVVFFPTLKFMFCVVYFRFPCYSILQEYLGGAVRKHLSTAVAGGEGGGGTQK